LKTCKFPDDRNAAFDANDNMKPKETSCWRFAFRFHQQESKESNGFLIQIEEMIGLGDGQKMETAMAREVNLKVFRTFTNSMFFDGDGWDSIKVISKAIQEWYDSGCANADLENIFVGKPNKAYLKRPKYETL